MGDWTWREMIQDGYRRPKVGQPTLRDVGLYPQDIARPVVTNPNGSVSTERMDIIPSGGGYRLKPTLGPPSIQTFRQFPTLRDAESYVTKRHQPLGEIYRFWNDMLRY